MSQTEIATFGAGCFWCIESAFNQLQGVKKALSGYMGGQTLNPDYRQVCTGTSGHAEVVQLEFDPTLVSFEQLLQVLWFLHDPTQLNRQGNDIGTQYRSAVFYHSEHQKQLTVASIQTAQALFDSPIVTEVSPASTFYPAEDYHQGYYLQNTSQPYCQYLITPKLAKFRQTFVNLLKA
ncbi:MAG: peptide-methionine (S)-S-oxide reductase MsrA [Gammaproteobacteria bacterium]|nr:peptide-methionine (S)-S-oxide reductase MsrA [Gammaproteobacteria bacterium]MBU2056699.1 peptide-methionine (S)-S-oxide reductase MsrA [Gammaproteobacteria bacterium]MBU2174036.1 peptide-methionine (S)-S-oxide reductase MsrA [Gammaproteobacteria bacterium]MBU2247342.1 peptide-methionine (S)-S-oxide reductase MsrA [Gammaproteobacteria bacterium]MBU2345046.1 peptide-methionine (S)-S-oxide reductase MsrA [Gammaproteobacteria bacterium]